MTATVVARPLATEQDLHRAFDAEYPALLGAARARLGEAAELAPRVVERTFAAVWREREEIESADTLRARLAEEVEHQAARALSRRVAAQRLGTRGHADAKHGAHDAAAASPAASWERVVHDIHAGEHSGEAHTAAVQATRRTAAAHVKGVAKKTSWTIPILLVVGAVAIYFAAHRLLDRAGRESALARAVASVDARKVSASPSQVAIVTLDDGTKARLSPESELFIPTTFSATMRGAKLAGSATFDVKAGGAEPFRLFAQDLVIVAPDAAFELRAFGDGQPTTIRVTRGMVTLRRGEESRPLAAGASLVVLADEPMRAPTADELAEALGWVNGQLVLVNRPLRVALPELRRWYRTDVKIIDAELYDRRVTVRTTTEATRDAIAQIEQTAKVKFGWEGETMLFRDVNDPKANEGTTRR